MIVKIKPDDDLKAVALAFADGLNEFADKVRKGDVRIVSCSDTSEVGTKVTRILEIEYYDAEVK